MWMSNLNKLILTEMVLKVRQPFSWKCKVYFDINWVYLPKQKEEKNHLIKNKIQAIDWSINKCLSMACRCSSFIIPKFGQGLYSKKKNSFNIIKWPKSVEIRQCQLTSMSPKFCNILVIWSRLLQLWILLSSSSWLRDTKLTWYSHQDFPL